MSRRCENCDVLLRRTSTHTLCSMCRDAETIGILKDRITELESALLALVNHVRQGPRIEYWLYDSTPIGRAVRVLGNEVGK